MFKALNFQKAKYMCLFTWGYTQLLVWDQRARKIGSLPAPWLSQTELKSLGQRCPYLLKTITAVPGLLDLDISQ